MHMVVYLGGAAVDSVAQSTKTAVLTAKEVENRMMPIVFVEQETKVNKSFLSVGLWVVDDV